MSQPTYQDEMITAKLNLANDIWKGLKPEEKIELIESDGWDLDEALDKHKED